MKKKEELLWFQKYRPLSLETYIGNEDLKSYLESSIQQNDIQNLIFHGKPGAGKTTAAKIIINNLKCDSLYLNASDDNGIETVRGKISDFALSASFKPLKIVVLDDCHNLTPAAQQALLNLIETRSKSTRFIFTTNSIGKIIPALQSRCQTFSVLPPERSDVAEFIDGILIAEGIKYELDDLVTIINKHFPDIRKIINVIQASSKDNILRPYSGKETIDYIQQILDILWEKNPKKGKDKWIEIRQVIADNALNDFTDIYRSMYEMVSCFTNKGELTLAIAEAEYQSAFVPDREITFMACIHKILQIDK
jgi:DNA polymerase III delta prime subunit